MPNEGDFTEEEWNGDSLLVDPDGYGEIVGYVLLYKYPGEFEWKTSSGLLQREEALTKLRGASGEGYYCVLGEVRPVRTKNV